VTTTKARARRSTTVVPAVVADLRAEQPSWEALGVEERVKWVRRYRDWLLDNEKELAALLREDTGKPAAEAPIELHLTIDLANYYCANAASFLKSQSPRPHNLLTFSKALEVEHRPYQVVGIITPWNFPLALTLFDCIPALLAGAAVVTKASEFTPRAVAFAAAGWKAIGAPPVFRVVEGAGDVGQDLVDQVDYVQFTGSTRTGTLVAQQAAGRLIPFSLELGGKDPAVVLADANLDQAAAGVVFGGLMNAGQMCTSVERVYVEAPVYDEFVLKLVEKVGELRQNADDGFATDLGPMVVDSQADIVERHVDDAVAKGATVRIGGERVLGGRFFQPTVLTGVDHTMDVMTQETFGPVLPVMKVADADEAVRLANDSDYGLSASVWTGDKKRGKEIARRLEVGAVEVNDVNTHLACFPVPQAGWKTSGVGARFGGAQGITKFCHPHVVTSNRVEVSLVQALAWFPYSATKAQVVGRMLRFLGASDVRRKLGI
jgi:betaine-aldehyde dehydrogenase